jgi:hypothetical protein
MWLSKNVAVAVAASASKKNRLFGLSREDLKLVTGATGVIVTSPTEEPTPVTDTTTSITVVFPLPALPVDPLAP